MLTNSQMKAGRYALWANYRRKVRWIHERLAEGRTVYITTYTKCTKLSAKHANMIKATRSGTWIARGKSWDCIDGCKISAV